MVGGSKEDICIVGVCKACRMGTIAWMVGRGCYYFTNLMTRYGMHVHFFFFSAFVNSCCVLGLEFLFRGFIVPLPHMSQPSQTHEAGWYRCTSLQIWRHHLTIVIADGLEERSLLEFGFSLVSIMYIWSL